MSASTQQLAWTFAPSPNQNWTRRAYHGGEHSLIWLSIAWLSLTQTGVVVGNYLYIDGGEVAIGNTPWSLSIKGPNYTPIPGKILECSFRIVAEQTDTAVGMKFWILRSKEQPASCAEVIAQ